MVPFVPSGAPALLELQAVPSTVSKKALPILEYLDIDIGIALRCAMETDFLEAGHRPFARASIAAFVNCESVRCERRRFA
jgi:hypothetical protein